MASVSAKDDGAGIRTAAPVAPSTKAPAHGRRAVQAHRRVVRSSTTESDEVMTPRTEAYVVVARCGAALQSCEPRCAVC